MANLQKAVVIGLSVLANGTDTVFMLDLLRDPYRVDAGSGAGVEVKNWFSDNQLATKPTGVTSPGSSDTVTLSGTVVTYTFATAPAAGQSPVEFLLLFPA